MGLYVKDFDHFISLIQQHRWRRDKIVTVNGCFDIIHAAHIRLLQESRRLGDVLIVGLNSDESVRRIKSSIRPFLSLAERAKTIASFDCVTYVTSFEEDTPCEWLQKIKPDVHVNDASYGIDCVEAPILAEYGGRLHLVEKYADLSTTDIAKIIYNKCQENNGFPD